MMNRKIHSTVASNEDYSITDSMGSHSSFMKLGIPTMTVLCGLWFWMAENAYNFSSSFPNLSEGMMNMYRRDYS